VNVDDMDTLLTRTENRVRRAWVAMLVHLREENSDYTIRSKLAAGHYDALAGLETSAAKFAAGTHAAYVASGQATAKWLNEQFRKDDAPVKKKLVAFDAADPAAVRWAEQNRLRLIREVTNEQRDAIREVLVAGARSGANPREMARQIRDSIGLTQHQAAIVENYRRELEARQWGDALARELTDGRHDRSVQSVMRSGGGLTPGQIDTMTEKYRANWVAYRAETIGRTEGLRVAHQANFDMYTQAIAAGDIDAAQIEQTWNHSPGRRDKRNERAFHKVMHGQKRGWGEPFVSGLGNELRFPGDPEAPIEETAGCACGVSTRLLRRR
jgi:hypothetical protein